MLPRNSPVSGSKFFSARGTSTGSFDTKVLPFSLPVNLVPAGRVIGLSGFSFWTSIRPPAFFTSPLSFSYRLVPPAISRLPLASCVCPVQNRSFGVGTFLMVFLTGSQIRVSYLFASKLSWLLPDPATSSTLPVRSSAAWMVFCRYFSGNSTISHLPFAALYSG